MKAASRRTASIALGAVFSLGVLSWPASGQSGQRGQVEVGTYGAFTKYDALSLGLVDEFGAGGRLAVFLSQTFSIEAFGDFTQTETVTLASDRVTVARVGGSLFANKRFIGSNSVYLGAGYERVYYRAGEIFEDNGIHVALGDRLPLGGRAAFRIEGRAAYFPNSPRQVADDRVFNVGASAGLSIFAFGGAPRDADQDGVSDGKDQCPDTPLGALVDRGGCPTDGDGDAVFDGLDQCADTPTGAGVDALGCPTDADGDTVFDGIDICPATPLGATVDENGCHSDSDSDGVFDGLDQCADTPAGAVVDEFGCPTDEDGDGVFDGIDQCPATPAGTVVDPNGCPPRDTDNDGVPDDIDRCPSSAPGQQVDAVGCPILFAVEEGTVQPLVLQGVNFATGSSRLTTESYSTLDQVAASLRAHPEVSIEVAGHTDATGSRRTNARLSQARAEAVRTYLAQQGIEVERMAAQGYGPDEPIATNSTRDGRALNRRVELRKREP